MTGSSLRTPVLPTKVPLPCRLRGRGSSCVFSLVFALSRFPRVSVQYRVHSPSCGFSVTSGCRLSSFLGCLCLSRPAISRFFERLVLPPSSRLIRSAGPRCFPTLKPGDPPDPFSTAFLHRTCPPRSPSKLMKQFGAPVPQRPLALVICARTSGMASRWRAAPAYSTRTPPSGVSFSDESAQAAFLRFGPSP